MKVMTQALPLGQTFRISRGVKTAAEVVIVVLTDGQHYGWAESVPYARYGETLASVCAQLAKVSTQLLNITEPAQLAGLLPAGSARNALDCALWDLCAKQQQRPVFELLGLPMMQGCHSAQTISLDEIDAMTAAASQLRHNKLLKVKLDKHDVVARMQAIHQACPHSQFIVDPNEGWDMALLAEVAEPLKACNVVLLEQPLAASEDQQLADFKSPIAICADESCHTSKDLERLLPLYQAINIKLDKTGGLSEAVQLLYAAKHHDLQVMVGCMVASSLAMAPAYLLCGQVGFVDLDGPLLVKQDRANGFIFAHGHMSSKESLLWGLANNASQAQILECLQHC